MSPRRPAQPSAPRDRSPRPPSRSRRSAADQENAIHAVVRAIHRGKVATYGEVAELAGIPSGHRVAARVMRSCPERLPWQRVIAKKDARRGQISIDDPEHAALQRALLEAEGIVFDANGFISLAQFGWRPHISAPARSTSRAVGAAPRKKKSPQRRG
jgi:methylated-DNA-protein-cysteine methyltransferase-like protein